MNRVLLFSLMIVATATGTALAAHPPTLYDTAGFQALLPAGDTYVDLDEVNAPESAISWGFPDGSDSSFTVNQNVADEKGNDAAEMNMALAGLLPNTLYSVDVVIFGKAFEVGGSTEEYDVSAGFVSGNLTDYLWTDGTQVTSYVVDSGEDTGFDIGLWRIPIGTWSSDNGADLHVYLGPAGVFPAGPRTEIDGLIYSVVPEPSTALLASMGLLGLFCRCRRRSA